MRLAVRAAACGLAAVMLAGCATRPPAEAGAPWTSGRLSVRVEASANRPANSLTADFDLRGDASRGELRLNSPFGSRLATTRWTDEGAVLDAGQGETRYQDLDAMSREVLGEALPLRALPDWLAGRPWPGAASVSQAAGFDQLGWSVSLAAWAEGRIEAVRSDPPRVTVRVRVDRARP